MAKIIKDLSPKMNGMMTADQELVQTFSAGERPLGSSMGGLQMFSDRFVRGYGNAVFGSDKNGIWLGAADFENAPFKVGVDGAINISDDNSSSEITADYIMYSEDDTPVIFIGDTADV